MVDHRGFFLGRVDVGIDVNIQLLTIEGSGNGQDRTRKMVHVMCATFEMHFGGLDGFRIDCIRGYKCLNAVNFIVINKFVDRAPNDIVWSVKIKHTSARKIDVAYDSIDQNDDHIG